MGRLAGEKGRGCFATLLPDVSPCPTRCGARRHRARESPTPGALRDLYITIELYKCSEAPGGTMRESASQHGDRLLRTWRVILLITGGVRFFAAEPLVAQGGAGATGTGALPPARAALARAVQEVEALDLLRSTLARTFAAGGVSANDSTFAQVCKPVKGKAMALAKETGWTISQLALRNRNADNALDDEALRAYRQLQKDPALTGLMRHTIRRGVAGTRYFRRITVEPACLACHGARDQRPEFVTKNYPADRAYGFAAGDLRGVYSVFIPDTAKADDRR